VASILNGRYFKRSGGIFIGGILWTRADVLNGTNLGLEVMYHSTAYIFTLYLTLLPKAATRR
jgi:hypothetical protein